MSSKSCRNGRSQNQRVIPMPDNKQILPDYTALFSAFFHEAADAAGTVALKYFRKVIPVDDKDDKSPVTQADREIEQTLISLRVLNHRRGLAIHG